MAIRKFQVWHKDGDGFTHVANVRTGNLLGALVFTLDPKGGRWQDNPEVEAIVKDARNTTFGDRIVNPDGLAYSIHNFSGVGAGFKEADSPAGDMRARFAEVLRMKNDERRGSQSIERERGGHEI